MNIIYSLILFPVLGGILATMSKLLKKEFAFLGALLGFYYALRIFFITRTQILFSPLIEFTSYSLTFRIDSFGGFLVLFVGGLGFFILLYSLRALRPIKEDGYYGLFLFLLTSSFGVVCAGDFLTLLVFWGLSLSCLYGLFTIGKKDPEVAWTKALFILGISDFLLLFGVIILILNNGNLLLTEPVRLSLRESNNIISFVLISIGALAKAGAVPLHTWIPEAAKVLPATTLAFIPVSLDKLLGIYLLTRISVWTFDLSTNLVLRNILMFIGVLTIIAAVMMALVQKEAMRLLSFHAVSQVGYMVLGIGTGIPIGIAGGIFHMVNDVISKSSLFLGAGSVEHWTKETELDKTGGLARNMPLTFISFLVAAMAISGVPPLNGFFSKWMVYQGVLSLQREGSLLFPIFLVGALLGSVLTLASFLKLTHSLFLGERPKNLEKVREVGFSMLLPQVIFALLCLLFGIFAYSLPLSRLIYPSLPLRVEEIGFFQPGLATILIISGLGIGVLIYLCGKMRPSEKKVFVGGEELELEERRYTGTHFYSDIKKLPLLEMLYAFGEGGAFDIYNYLRGLFYIVVALFRFLLDRFINFCYDGAVNLLFALGKWFSGWQSGNLTSYLRIIFLLFLTILILLGIR